MFAAVGNCLLSDDGTSYREIVGNFRPESRHWVASAEANRQHRHQCDSLQFKLTGRVEEGTARHDACQSDHPVYKSCLCNSSSSSRNADGWSEEPKAVQNLNPRFSNSNSRALIEGLALEAAGSWKKPPQKGERWVLAYSAFCSSRRDATRSAAGCSWRYSEQFAPWKPLTGRATHRAASAKFADDTVSRWRPSKCFARTNEA